jgi:hypothetical protein
MKVTPEKDPDGVDREDTSAELHENTRSSAEGVEEEAVPSGGEGEPATGLIGAGQAVDPRYVGQR